MEKIRIMAAGVFDLLHIGHLHYLQEAKEMGDELVVVVATDETVKKQKHDPIIPQEMRRELVEGLKPVDKAIVGYEEDPLKIVEEIDPDIIALGYDQPSEGLDEKLLERGMDIKIVRCSKYGKDLNGTRKIIKKIYERSDRNEKDWDS